MNEFRSNVRFHFGRHKRKVFLVHVALLFDAGQKIDQRVQIDAHFDFRQILTGIRLFGHLHRVQSVDDEWNFKAEIFLEV